MEPSGREAKRVQNVSRSFGESCALNGARHSGVRPRFETMTRQSEFLALKLKLIRISMCAE